MNEPMTTTTEPAILLHWGNVWEDFLDSIGVSFKAFCNEMTGGWMFGYIEALRRGLRARNGQACQMPCGGMLLA